MHRWAHRRVPRWARDAADTADFVQDTILNGLRNLPVFEPQRDGWLLGYLRRSLLNRVKDQYRHAARHHSPVSLDENRAGALGSPLEFAIAREDRERYRVALKRLRARDRHAIVGRLDLGYSYAQLALILNKPSDEAARLAVRRALMRLATEMRRA